MFSNWAWRSGHRLIARFFWGLASDVAVLLEQLMDDRRTAGQAPGRPSRGDFLPRQVGPLHLGPHRVSSRALLQHVGEGLLQALPATIAWASPLFFESSLAAMRTGPPDPSCPDGWSWGHSPKGPPCMPRRRAPTWPPLSRVPASILLRKGVIRRLHPLFDLNPVPHRPSPCQGGNLAVCFLEGFYGLRKSGSYLVFSP
jgi:hypothetical protein